jgi:hypothetical protein
MDHGQSNHVFNLSVCALGRAEAPFSIKMRDHMKKVLFAVALCVATTPAVAQIASRGSIVNSARVEQTAGAFAFSQILQAETVTVAPVEPLVRIDSGAFIMPYINESFNASRGGELRVYDPVGSFIDGDFSVTNTNPLP